MREKGNFPYKNLGERLKKMRERSQISLVEVSGAVEIDVDMLSRIEQGSDCPPEEILLLLISYFGVKEDEAVKLWELANYDRQKLPVDLANNDKASVLAPEDARILYTDMVHVSANDYGVVMNFVQGNGPSGQPLIISRVGMSKKQARSIVEILSKTLESLQPKSIPAPDRSRDKQSKS